MYNVLGVEQVYACDLKKMAGGVSTTITQKNINKQNVRVDVEYPQTVNSSGNVHVHVDQNKHYMESLNDMSVLPKAVRKDSDIIWC